MTETPSARSEHSAADSGACSSAETLPSLLPIGELLREVQRANEQLKAEKDELRRRIQQLKSENDRYQSDNERLEGEAEYYRNYSVYLENQTSQLKGEADYFQSVAEEGEGKSRQAVGVTGALADQVTELTSELADAIAQRDEMKGRADYFESQTEELHNYLEFHKRNLLRVTSERDELRAKVGNEAASVEQVDRWKRLAQQERNAADRLRLDRGRLEEELESLEAQLAERQSVEFAALAAPGESARVETGAAAAETTSSVLVELLQKQLTEAIRSAAYWRGRFDQATERSGDVEPVWS